MPEPPNVFATVGAMGAGGELSRHCVWPNHLEFFALRLRLGTVAVGCHSPLVPLSSLHAALGAVFIAAVGVWGVFKISFWVASETGRSLNAEKQAAVAAPAAPPAAGSPDGAAAAQRQAGTAPAGDVKAASPLEAWRPGGGAASGMCLHALLATLACE